MNRPLTSVATLLFLASSTLAYQSPAEPDAQPATESAADTSKFPNLFTHPIGFSIRHPADWQIKNISGTNALIPNDAPIRQGNPAELYALAAMPAPEGADIAAELQSEMTKAFPALELTKSSKVGDSVLLRFQASANPEDPSQPRGAATVRGVIRDKILIVMMGFGIDSAIAKHDALASEIFATTAATPRVLDQSIRGTWTHSSSYSSTGYSMASVRKCTLNADGTYRHTSETAGGTADVSADTGESAATGIWSAKDGTLTLITADGTTLTFKYRLVDGSLVTYDAGNKRTIWSR